MDQPTNGEIRAWARENGHIVADRGRIPAIVMAAYTAAHQRVHSPDDRAHAPAFDHVHPSGDDAMWSRAGAGDGVADADADEAGDGFEADEEDEADEQARPGDLEPPRFQRPWAVASPDAPGHRSPPDWGPPSGPPPPPPAWGPPAGGAPPAWGRGSGPGEPPPAAPPPATGRDSGALPALLLGIFPIFAGIPAIVFGAISLSRIRRTHQSGRGMAIAGIVLGTVWLLIVLGIGLATALSESGGGADDGAPGVRRATAEVLRLGTVRAEALRVGDCPSALPDGTVKTVELGSCSQPHRGEVYAVFDLPGSAYPGEAEVARLANVGCSDRLTTFVGAARQGAFDAFYLVPVKSSWDRGERDVPCILTHEDGSPLPPGSAKAG